MILQGTIVNCLAIVGGSVIGLMVGSKLPDRYRATMLAGLGLAVLLIGLQLAIGCQQPLIIIASLLCGGIVGEIVRIDRRLDQMGDALQNRFKKQGKIAEGFVAASLIYCVGAMAIMGSLQDGLGESPSILYAKSALDGIASIALGSTLGFGVIFSAVAVGIYQGGLTMAAATVSPYLTETVVTEMNTVGGLLIIAIGLDLLDIKRLPIANLLPGVFFVAPLMWIFGLA